MLQQDYLNTWARESLMLTAACAVNLHRLVFARFRIFAVWVDAFCGVWLLAVRCVCDDGAGFAAQTSAFNAHRTMSTRDPSNLEADLLRIGECTVTLSSREVVVPGVRRVRRLTPKAMGVLRALVRNSGRVVTRDELFAEVWPDTLPTNDVLTQAVTQLRKAFASDDDGGLVYIETIAKTGYRLMVPVTVVVADAPAAVPADEGRGTTPPAASAAIENAPVVTKSALSTTWRRIRRTLLVAAGVCLLCSVVVMGWMLQRVAPPSPLEAAVDQGTRVLGSPQRPYRLVTATAGFETFPSLSPDGSQVTYEASSEDGMGGDIKVQTASNAPARLLVERPAGASDRFPNWSPDGRDIAFARFFADGRCEVLIASATGGNVRHATRCDGTELLSFDWTPDGRGLVFGSMVGAFGHAGIRVLELASGRWRALQYPVRADDFDYAPRFSPDGKWLVFVRNPQVGDLWRMPAEGGTPEQLTDDAAEIRGWAWMGDSQHIVYGRRVDSEVRLYQLDTDEHTLRDMGLDDAQWPAVARSAGVLAFVQRKAQFGMYQVPVDGRTAPARLYAASARDSQPTLSPDGRQLVFASDRSGTYSLWWSDLQRPDSLRPIEGLRPDTRQQPDWSPDSRHVLIVGRDDRGQPRIYELSPQDEQTTELPAPVQRPLQALYTDDPMRLLLIERDDDQRTRLTLYDRSTAPWRRVASLDGVSQARYDARNRRVLFTRFGAGGLWQADTALAPASVAVVSEDRPSRWMYRAWTVNGANGIDYLESSMTCSTMLTRISHVAQAESRCLDAARLSASNGFSSSADGTTLLVSLAVTDGADIGIMPLPDTALASFPAIIKPLMLKGKGPS